MSQNDPVIAEIQNLPLAELPDRLEGLTIDQLQALRALEESSGTRRAGAFKAIDAAIEKAAPATGGAAATATTQAAGGQQRASAAADAKPGDTPAWQREDYDGPLDIVQADWRRQHLVKPVQGARTK